MHKEIIFVLRAIIKSKKGFLLIKRSKDDEFAANKWEFPGGKAEDWIIVKDIGREIKEEVGMWWLRFGKLKVISIRSDEAELKKYQGKKIITLLLSAKTFWTCVKLSHEHDDFVWIKSLAEVEGLDLKDGVLEILQELFEEE